MTIKKEYKIAFVFIVTLLLLYWGLNFLKGRDLFNKQRKFYVVYNQVNGLVVSNNVLVNGMRVGQVNKMYFHPDNSGRIVTELIITNGDLKIPKNSVARLISGDLLGPRAVDLQLGNSKVEAVEGDTLNSFVQSTLTQEVNVQIQPVKQKFEAVMSSLDSVLVIIKSVFNENTQRNLELSFSSIRNTIQNLESTTYNIDTLVVTQKHKLSSIIGNVESITANIKNNNDKITNIINNFSSISDTIAKAKLANTITNANKSLKEFNEILEKINKGDGSLGLLLNNDELYNNLNKASKDLDNLIIDVKENPNRYVSVSVFGGGGSKKKKTSEPETSEPKK